jgi:hypothetical protein
MTIVQVKLVVLLVCALLGLSLSAVSLLCMLHLADLRFLGAFVCTGIIGLAMAEVSALAILEVF